MPEPTSTTTGVGLLGLFVALLGPLAGPYAFILFGATLGAATALSARQDVAALDGAKFMVRVVATSLLFTGTLTSIVASVTHWPVEWVMGAVAYAIGWRWDVLAGELWPWVLQRLGIKQPGGQ